MKKYIVITLLFISNFCLSQQVTKLKEYKATNEVVYKIGDFVQLGVGSLGNGNFSSMRIAGWMMPTEEINLKAYANLKVKIKKIKHIKNNKLGDKVMFTVGAGNMTNYTLDIELGIQTCEVTPCNSEDKKEEVKVSKYDELAKIKKLLDEGVLTQEEFEIEKKKILNR